MSPLIRMIHPYLVSALSLFEREPVPAKELTEPPIFLLFTAVGLNDNTKNGKAKINGL